MWRKPCVTKQLGKGRCIGIGDRAKLIERSDSRGDGDGDADGELNSSCRHWKEDYYWRSQWAGPGNVRHLLTGEQERTE